MQWLRMASILLLWAGVCRLAGAADTDNSLILANMDRTGWPDAMTSQANVDTASRAEVLMFGKALLASEMLDEQSLKQRLGVQDVKLKSVRRVRDGLWDRLLITYRGASQNCDGEPFCPRVRSVADLRQLAAAFTGEISPAHAVWVSKSQTVHEQALNDQLRVAVLVP
ncbi:MULTISPECIES: polysaccharide deacetylase [unclassified Pseudomonas]|uniref:polysaccharide deacetylase n=1 Tax=unclassified Pseudomonas TaxID=196821 RepID=UPI000C86A202|nr:MULTISPECIES: polysaccharide deacetylase [unclassified Pseudomonas]PMV89802.1 polysaccharide deacetylase [Pseudomonas sp. GW101-1A09]PMV90972.1 polysaccharide deacetylase [Pseudomonas sp. FW306-2-2C-B10A]PMW01686.1 polysaccharide deacetylase [Pseudomonas sp. GW460-C8]PMW03371.1 polysaccharide deacetylase [Pseudomonas sp. MPR-TSA4]PMW22423.1 polysaccharide deacetylase [Pseudomonas sp. FW306-2-1A-C05A]